MRFVFATQPSGLRRLPPDVQQGLLTVMQDFGLNYGAADFIVTREGRHVFLDVNAGGEWFWLQRNPELSIAAARELHLTLFLRAKLG